MSFTMEDTLESGWVAVRPNVFDEKEKHKFVFIVAWNEVEGKFAITCHNRTVQRRSAARSPVVEGTALKKKTEGISGVGMLEDKHKSLKSPVKETSLRGSATKLGNTKLIADIGTKSPLRGNSAKTPNQVKPISKAAGTRAKGAAGSMDMEYVDPTAIREDICSPQGDLADSDNSDTSSREHYSWAGLFSFQDMRAVHLQLCSVNSDLEPCLPAFPEEPSGMWTVLFGLPEVTQKDVEALCYQLQVYLGHALDTCGWKILSQVLFTESDDPEEYYESLSELRQKGYEDALQRAKARLQELLEKHKTTESMVELLAMYEEEDEAYGVLVEATTQLYQYLLQPFRDMRELSMLRRQQIKISMENDYLGPRRIESLKKEDVDWQKKAHAAVLSIQDLTVKYFEITARAQKAVYERMRADQRKFGKATWGTAVERMEKLQYAVSKETLQLMRAKEICLEQKKHTLRQEMQGLQGGADAMARLDQLESQYYELQLQLYEVQFEVLRYEELLLTAQLESIRRQAIERQDEVVYYDTYESMDAILAIDDAAAPVQPRKEELFNLQQRARQLEARRGRITSKKAYLRNKKDICIANHNEKMQQRHGIHEDHKSQHALPQREQKEEEKRNSQVSQERQTTLDRLRSFKQRYPGQVILKSTRLRLAYARRKGAGLSGTGVGSDRPQALTTAAQSEENSTALEPLESHTTATVASQHESTSLPPGGATALKVHPGTAPASLPPGGNLTALVSPVSPGPPPPPPPLPPPLPLPTPAFKEPEDKAQGQPESPVQEPRDKEKEAAVASAIGPVSARFFDSSQLVNARKKLKKTAALEASQRRRASSPMDEVLASLKRGSFHLRKAELRVLRPDPDEDDGNNILAQIRKGVKLKKVQQRELRDTADPLTRSIHEALRRIKEASPESESEDEGLPCADWES